MLSCVEFQKGQKILDLGCGYGVIGITSAKLIGGIINMSVIIKTERLILREFEINDAGKFTEICNQEHILKWMPDWKMTEFQVEGWIKRSQQSYS